mgnify:FL=1|jgi:hypothetical protein
MFSPLPAISLVLPLFSGFSRKSSTASGKSDFKHYDGTPKWDPIGKETKDSSDYECYEMMSDGTIRGHKHIMHKHVCVTPDNCPFGGVDEYCLECHYGLPEYV